MYFYPFYQWLLFFFAYCFVGWIWETSYVTVTERHFVNRGFMYGTWIPIYGFGAIIMLFTTLPFKGNWVMVYLVGMVSATILELVTGLTMEKIFKIRYWDYSSQKIQFKGYICLGSSLFWGLLSVVLVKWVHAFFEKLIFMIPGDIQIPLAFVLSAIFFTDLGFSIKSALDIRSVIVKLEKLREELERITDEFTEKVAEKADELTDRVAEKADEFTDKVEKKADELTDMMLAKREELTRLVAERREELRDLSVRLIKRNPSAVLPTLPHMNEAVKEIRDRLRKRLK